MAPYLGNFPKHATYRNMPYLPWDVTAYTNDAVTGQRLAMYYPVESDRVRKPPNGWPCLMWFNFSGFVSSSGDWSDASNREINPVTWGFVWQCLARGIAVAMVQVTSSLAAKAYTGKGFFNAPGGVNSSATAIGSITDAGGYYEDRARPMAEKDAIYAIQFLRYKATTLLIDPNAIGVSGNSAGACISAWLAFSPNRACELGTGGQYNMSTVPCVFAAELLPQGWWGAYLSGTVTPAHFPATAGGAVAAANLAAAPAGYLRADSIFGYCGSVGNPIPPMIAIAEGSVQVANNFYQPFPTTGAESTPHSPWQLYSLKAAWPEIKLYLPAAAQAGAPGIGSILGADTNLYTGILSDSGVDAVGGRVGDAGTELEGMPIGTFVDFIAEKIRKPPWDGQPLSRQVIRTNLVNLTGRCIVPPNPCRKRLRLACTSTVANGLRYGPTMDRMQNFIPATNGAGNTINEQIIEGTGPLYARADVTGTAGYSVAEE